MDGYHEFKEEDFKKDGYLYSFTGLRGDAKDLYLRVMRGEERRVALIQAPTATEQHQFVTEADVVIWACGYTTKNTLIRDVDKQVVELS